MGEGSPGQLFLENFPAAAGRQLNDLRVQVLGGRTHPGIAVNHGVFAPVFGMINETRIRYARNWDNPCFAICLNWVFSSQTVRCALLTRGRTQQVSGRTL